MSLVTQISAGSVSVLKYCSAEEKPLCVDLDGTLIQSDLLWESIVVLLGRNPFYVLRLLVWLLNGRAHLKRQVSLRVSIDPQSLPYNTEFLSYLQAQQQANRRLILVTAADRIAAEPVFRHLAIFSQMIASDHSINLKGKHKRERLVQQFGACGYDYAGDSQADLQVWKDCRRAIVVTGSSKLSRQAASISTVEQCFAKNRNGWKVWLKAIRVHQWVKNLLVFVPLIAAHQLFQVNFLRSVTVAFAAFSLCASSVYVLNDLLDLHSDRLHPAKRKRPFASGALSIPVGLCLVTALLSACVVISLFLPWQFQLVLAVYYGLTLAYSLSLKRKLLVDVFVLSALYSIRVLAGGAVTGILLSPWLLAFCLFFFVSLALTKRFTELLGMPAGSRSSLAGRRYIGADLQAIGSLGTTSGFMCVLVLALYINSPQVLSMYQSPVLLWLLCPLILYWISRVWLIAYRGNMNVDPVLFALKDKISLMTAFCGALIMMAAARGLHP